MISALIGLQTSTINSSNAQANIMRNCHSMGRMAFGANMKNVDTFASRERDLLMDNVQNQVQYAISEQLKKSYEQYLNKKIKESFSIFA